MRKGPVTTKARAGQGVKDIRRATRKRHSSEVKIRIVLSGLRGEDSIADLRRREGIAQSLYSSWSKEFLDSGKKRLAGGITNRCGFCNDFPFRMASFAIRPSNTLDVRAL